MNAASSLLFNALSYLIPFLSADERMKETMRGVCALSKAVRVFGSAKIPGVKPVGTVASWKRVKLLTKGQFEQLFIPRAPPGCFL